jgi:hypothetical protein
MGSVWASYLPLSMLSAIFAVATGYTFLDGMVLSFDFWWLDIFSKNNFCRGVIDAFSGSLNSTEVYSWYIFLLDRAGKMFIPDSWEAERCFSFSLVWLICLLV